MNERIRELAKEAGGGPSKWYTDPNVLEKFVELIVEECKKINSELLGHNTLTGLHNMYKDHFGVEE